jgi:predicted O-methyltransferase YrrM
MALQTLNIRFEDGRERGFRHRGTRADLGVIEQIFQQQDYSLKPLQRGAELQALYERIAGAGQAPLILDAGANIGASVLYFAQAFPRARIAALEPARNNFEVLQANIAGLEVDARCAASARPTAKPRSSIPAKANGAIGPRPAAAGKRSA